MQRACGESSQAPSRSRSPLVAAVGVVPAQAELQLGIQDDALLTSQEPNAWPFAKGLAPKVVRYNIGWEQVAPARPEGARRPGRSAPTTSSTPTRWPSRRPRSARRACSRSSTRRAGRTAARRPRFAPLNADDYGQFCGVVAWRYSGTYTPPGALVPLPAVKNFTVWNEPNRGQYLHAAGPRRPDRRAHVRRARARLRRRRARRLAGRARRRRADREPRRAGRRIADRVPRRLQQGGRPAPAGARVQPVHERPRARPTSPRRRRPTAPSRCATSTSSSTG